MCAEKLVGNQLSLLCECAESNKKVIERENMTNYPGMYESSLEFISHALTYFDCLVGQILSCEIYLYFCCFY